MLLTMVCEDVLCEDVRFCLNGKVKFKINRQIYKFEDCAHIVIIFIVSILNNHFIITVITVAKGINVNDAKSDKVSL